MDSIESTCSLKKKIRTQFERNVRNIGDEYLKYKFFHFMTKKNGQFLRKKKSNTNETETEIIEINNHVFFSHFSVLFVSFQSKIAGEY